MVCTKYFAAGALFEGFREYGIGVIIVEHHDVLAATAGGDWESTGLVRVDPSWFFDGGEKLVGGEVIGLLCGVGSVVDGVRWLFG